MTQSRTGEELLKEIAQLRTELDQARAGSRPPRPPPAPPAATGDTFQPAHASIARPSLEEQASQHEQDLELLSSTGLAFLEMNPEDDLLTFVGEHIYALAEGAIVIVTAYNASSNQTTVHAIFGLGDGIDRLVRLLGRHPVGLSLKVTDKYRQMMSPGELGLVPDGLYGLSFEQIPLLVCRTLEQAWQIKNVYATPFAVGDDLLGTIAILTHSKEPLPRAPLIRAFLRQAAVAVKRRRAELALRQSEGKYRTFFEHLQEMVSVCEVVRDEQGRIVDWVFRDANAVGLSLYGFERHDLVGKRASQVLDEPFFVRIMTTYSRVLVTGEPESLEIHFKEQHFLLSVFRMDENTVASTGIDITERKQREREIQILNRDLAARAAELEGANSELESFSYTVSHDLKAPLAAMNVYSRLVLEDYGAQLPEDGQQFLQLIYKNAVAMNHLIEGLLAFSRTTRQPLNKAWVDMNEMVHQIVDELQRMHAGRPVEVTLTELPSAEADPVLVKQVWINLLSNAFKFSRTRDVARIEVGTHERTWSSRERTWSTREVQVRGQWAHVNSTCVGSELTCSPRASTVGRNRASPTVYYVRDNGVGFDMDKADKLFGVFQRLHAEGDYEGTGVGLAIVERIVRRHGGRVWAEGKTDHGATFYFTLAEHPSPAIP